jgi:hypothetical protein
MAIVPIESYARLLLGKSESRGGRGGTRRRGGLLSGSRFRRRLDLLSIHDPKGFLGCGGKGSPPKAVLRALLASA